jgi:hypothetical protein
MTVRGALKAALRHLYEHSWRLLLLNAAVALVASAVLVVVVASSAPTTLLLLVVVGPFAAALMHCAVTLQQTDRLRLGDALVGLRLHWRRGLALGALVAAAAILVVTAVSFWTDRGALAWPFAVLAIYVACMFAVLQIHLWPLAVALPRTDFADVLREAGLRLARRPFSSCALAFALLLVNAVGAIGVLPVLSLTIAYSALAAAHFVLPRSTEEATP